MNSLMSGPELLHWWRRFVKSRFDRYSTFDEFAEAHRLYDTNYSKLSSTHVEELRVIFEREKRLALVYSEGGS